MLGEVQIHERGKYGQTITQREGSSPLALEGSKSCLVIVLLPLLCCTRDTSSRCSGRLLTNSVAKL